MIPITATNRSILSSYRKTDSSAILTEEQRTRLIPALEKDGADIIVFHPGSRNTRIGTAKDPFPKTVCSVLANRLTGPSERADNTIPFPCLGDHQRDHFDEHASDLLDNKAPYLKRKAIFNAAQQVLSISGRTTPS